MKSWNPINAFYIALVDIFKIVDEIVEEIVKWIVCVMAFLKVSDVFREYRNVTLGEYGLMC